MICSFKKCLLSIYYVPGTLLGTENMAVNKTDRNICPHGMYVVVVVVVMATMVMIPPDILSPYCVSGSVVSALYVLAHTYSVM